MRIGIDLRPLQTQQSRNRGIGNYVSNLVEALLRIAPHEEILLFYAAGLQPPALLETAVPGPHWRAIPLEMPSEMMGAPGQPIDPGNDLRQSSLLQAALSNYDLDVFHLTSPFEWEIGMGASFSVCRMVATLYDLIPLVLAPIYLSPASPELREMYLNRLKLLAQADRLMAISDASRRDAVEWLGLCPDRIDVIWAGANERFQPLSDHTLIEAVRSKFGLPGQYILSVLGYHYTKNIEGALAAYSYLPASLREIAPLVIVCRLPDEGQRALSELAQRHGIRSQVVLTGEIEQNDLIALYNGATVSFYPSRYDGFGLPVLEAMQCGAPVVTSTSSSLPEVAGSAALLGDPDDPKGLAAMLESLLTQPDLRQQLRERGFAQARQFSWQRVAEETLRVYRQAAEPLPSITVRSPRLKLAYWSPLNPCRSGISDYSEQLLLHLAQHADIDVYVDGYVPTADAITDQFAVYDHGVYSALASSRRYDVNLYQMGNSLFHEYIYKALLTEPGVVVLHDYILQGFIHHITELRGQRDRYLDEIEYNEGRQARDQVERDLTQSRLDLYAYSLNRRIVEASLGIIVHNQWMRAQLEQQGAHKPIAVIPHGVNVLPVNPKRAGLLRSSLGIEPDTLVLGCFGRIVPAKRVDVVVRAFSRLHAVLPRSNLFLVGEADAGMADYLGKLTGRLKVGDSVRITGHVTVQAFDGYLQISDVCINLRYPSAGETSGTLCRALGAGLPVLASDLPQFAEFPDDCVWKVGMGEEEEDELAAYLLELAFHPGLRRQLGQRAQDYIAERATWPRVAAQYIEFLEQAAHSRS